MKKNIRVLVAEHKHHITGALILSAGIYCALVLVTWFGIGGIKQHPWLLLAGFAIAEAGRSFTCFGQQGKRVRLEYLGVLVQGLAWWVWALNLEFLGQQQGAAFLAHLLVPAIVIGFWPVAAHHFAKHLVALMGWDGVRPPASKRTLAALVLEHKRHMAASFGLAFAIAGALLFVSHMDVGGIKQDPWLLLGGFLLAEVGRSLTCFGVQLKHPRTEYCGVFMQGLAWWLWSVNLPYLGAVSGWATVIHLLLPALLISSLPAVAHHGAKHLIALKGWNKVC